MLLEKQSAAIDIRQELSYRRPVRVTRVCCYRGINGRLSFPICPRCEMTMEREYQSYCDRCGQRLSWIAFEKAVVVIQK